MSDETTHYGNDVAQRGSRQLIPSEPENRALGLVVLGALAVLVLIQRL